jgi:hypothetical protein
MIITAILSSNWGGEGFGDSTFIAFSNGFEGTFTNHILQNVSPTDFSFAWCHHCNPIVVQCLFVMVLNIVTPF